MVGEFFMMTLQQIDMSILLWIQEHLRADALTPFWKVITFLGNGGWFWLVLAAGLLISKKICLTGGCGITFHYSRLPYHECAAEEYCCPPKTF